MIFLLQRDFFATWYSKISPASIFRASMRTLTSALLEIVQRGAFQITWMYVDRPAIGSSPHRQQVLSPWLTRGIYGTVLYVSLPSLTSHSPSASTCATLLTPVIARVLNGPMEAALRASNAVAPMAQTRRIPPPGLGAHMLTRSDARHRACAFRSTQWLKVQRCVLAFDSVMRGEIHGSSCWITAVGRSRDGCEIRTARINPNNWRRSQSTNSWIEWNDGGLGERIHRCHLCNRRMSTTHLAIVFQCDCRVYERILAVCRRRSPHQFPWRRHLTCSLNPIVACSS